jgi:hypothetical protein
MNLLVFIPGLSVLLFTVFEMPDNVKKVFFKVPVWISSTVIAIIVGSIARGVLGPMTGFMTELLLFPGLYFAKKHYDWRNKKKLKKEEKHGNITNSTSSNNNSSGGNRHNERCKVL